MHKDPANRLRKARQDRGFETASDAARSFGWPLPTYTSHENGIRNMSQSAARKYAAAFGVSPGWLLGLTDVHQTSATTAIIVGDASWGTWREAGLDPYKTVSKHNIYIPTSAGGG